MTTRKMQPVKQRTKQNQLELYHRPPNPLKNMLIPLSPNNQHEATMIAYFLLIENLNLTKKCMHLPSPVCHKIKGGNNRSLWSHPSITSCI